MIASDYIRENLARRIRYNYPVEDEIPLQFGNCHIQVQSNSESVIAGLKAYFSPFLRRQSEPDRLVISVFQADDFSVDIPLTEKMPDPGKTKIKEEYADIPDGRIVRKRLTGMVFVFGGADHIAIGPCMENLNQVVNFINNRYIEWLICHGGLLGHAAGISLHDNGIALAGFSGMGKSTLALHLVSKGADFVSNDRLVLEKSETGIRMHGVAKLPRVNPGTILNNPDLKGLLSDVEYARFSALSQEDIWNLEHKFDVRIDRFFGSNRFVLSSEMDALVILNWQRNSQPTAMRPVDIEHRRDLLPAFMKSTGLFFLPKRPEQITTPTEYAYINILKKRPVFEISGGVDFEAAAEYLIGRI
ncbi:MAG: HprK-related kinase B [Desulfatirhabdiaceae bacterium]